MIRAASSRRTPKPLRGEEQSLPRISPRRSRFGLRRLDAALLLPESRYLAKNMTLWITTSTKRRRAAALQSRFAAKNDPIPVFPPRRSRLGVRRLDAAFCFCYSNVMTDWPHAPPHRLAETGAYMVTCGTYLKANVLHSPQRLDLVRDLLFSCASDYRWELHAWAILSNHYHFVASSPSDPTTLRAMLSKLHSRSARELNAQDGEPERKVWHQFFDTHLTFQTSYFPRLKYVHHNPLHHGVVTSADNYP